jgi:hypothetical protein
MFCVHSREARLCILVPWLRTIKFHKKPQQIGHCRLYKQIKLSWGEAEKAAKDLTPAIRATGSEEEQQHYVIHKTLLS